MVDDDNKPAQENIPTQGVVQVNNEDEWGWDGTCNRKLTGAADIQPAILVCVVCFSRLSCSKSTRLNIKVITN